MDPDSDLTRPVQGGCSLVIVCSEGVFARVEVFLGVRQSKGKSGRGVSAVGDGDSGTRPAVLSPRDHEFINEWVMPPATKERRDS